MPHHMKYACAVLACMSLGVLFLPVRAAADGDAASHDGVLTGNWGGMRTSLANKGIDIELIYKFDVISNTSGGIKTGTETLNNLDIKAVLDGEKLFGSQGTSAKIYYLNNNGSRPGANLVGDAEGIDNIEVRNPSGRLLEAWIQQTFMKDRFSFLAGLYDLNSEFYVTDASGLFIRPTFGIGTDMGQSGKNGPSIFPVTSAGVRFKVQPTQALLFQAAVLDGVPGDPNSPKGTHVRFNHGDGALIVGEADYVPGGGSPNGKMGFGAWEYTGKFDDFVDVDGAGNPVQRRSYGLYALGQRQVYQEPGHEGRGLNIFARVGVANGDVNQFDYAWSAGAVYTGLFPGREKGQLGLGVEGAHASSKYRNSVGTADASTTAFELAYNDNLTPWLAVQPDVQYIVNPGVDPMLKNALVVGARFTAKF
jgi:porin